MLFNRPYIRRACSFGRQMCNTHVANVVATRASSSRTRCECCVCVCVAAIAQRFHMGIFNSKLKIIHKKEDATCPILRARRAAHSVPGAGRVFVCIHYVMRQHVSRAKHASSIFIRLVSARMFNDGFKIYIIPAMAFGGCGVCISKMQYLFLHRLLNGVGAYPLNHI